MIFVFIWVFCWLYICNLLELFDLLCNELGCFWLILLIVLLIIVKSLIGSCCFSILMVVFNLFNLFKDLIKSVI